MRNIIHTHLSSILEAQVKRRLLSDRTDKIDSSGIRKIFNLAADMENPINLSIGQPDFDMPDPVKAAAIEAIEKGFNRYTVTRGNPELRKAVTERYRAMGVESDACLITSGTSGGLLLAFAAILNPGDEILVPDPYFVMYKHLINFLDGKPAFIDTYPDFRITRERLDAAVTDRTVAIIVNSPNNPTGHVTDAEEIDAVVELARERDLLIISDEIYDLFQYDSTMPMIGKLYPKTLVLNGFSKFAAMTGWRVGYALGPGELIDAMAEIQQYSFVCAPSVGQKAAMKALETHSEEVVAAYRRKRDLIYQGLKDRFDLVKSGGAFYAFPGTKNGDGDAFVEKAIQNNVLIVPGSVFSEKKTHFRISFAAKDETIKQGIEVMNRLADDLWG
jgi:aspartate aminotransferase/aminotransferase